MSDGANARRRLRAMAAPYYRPAELAAELLAGLSEMERLSDTQPEGSPFRRTTGLTCAAEFRGLPNRGDTENAIIGWLCDLHEHAAGEVRDLKARGRPDICFGYERDALGEDVVVVLEAKPVWQRWIAAGTKTYSGVVMDEFGRSSGNYASNNLRQVVRDRDKLLGSYTDPRDRHLLLALVFQRPGELDERLIDAVGPEWDVMSQHVPDLNNPPGDDIGMTGMVFWPRRKSAPPAGAPPNGPARDATS